MVNKFFALASLTALTGIVVAAASTTAGCSSTEVINVPFDASRDATTDRKLGDNEEPASGGLACMVQQQLDATSLSYKSPKIVPGACTEDSIKQIDTFINANKNATLTDLKNAMKAQNAQCAACVFSPESDAQWAPIVEATGGAYLNQGGCLEIVSGSANCGKAWHQLDGCINYGCKDCSDAEVDQCSSDIIGSGGPCNDAAIAVRSACGANLSAYLDLCFPANDLAVAGPIRYQCIKTPVSDAGTTDAAKNDQ